MSDSVPQGGLMLLPTAYRIEPGLDYYYRRKQMGRPLNKRYFGTPTAAGNEIKVQFFNGTASVPGWIVKQLGSKKFRCTDGTATADCVLTDAAAAALTAGQMSITVDDGGNARQLTKISGRKATMDNGSVTAWDFTGTGDVAEIEEAGDDAALTNADNIEGDVE